MFNGLFEIQYGDTNNFINLPVYIFFLLKANATYINPYIDIIIIDIAYCHPDKDFVIVNLNIKNMKNTI